MNITTEILESKVTLDQDFETVIVDNVYDLDGNIFSTPGDSGKEQDVYKKVHVKILNQKVRWNFQYSGPSVFSEDKLFIDGANIPTMGLYTIDISKDKKTLYLTSCVGQG